jgi:hypothetical protein
MSCGLFLVLPLPCRGAQTHAGAAE